MTAPLSWSRTNPHRSSQILLPSQTLMVLKGLVILRLTGVRLLAVCSVCPGWALWAETHKSLGSPLRTCYPEPIHRERRALKMESLAQRKPWGPAGNRGAVLLGSVRRHSHHHPAQGSGPPGLSPPSPCLCLSRLSLGTKWSPVPQAAGIGEME